MLWVAHGTPGQRVEPSRGGDPRILNFKEGEDPESFFIHFERVAVSVTHSLCSFSPAEGTRCSTKGDL